MALAELACAGCWLSIKACGGARQKEQVLPREERKVCVAEGGNKALIPQSLKINYARLKG